jgi:hypothetical protein
VIQYDKEMMKRWFSMLMLIGALLGLLGQETAFASAPSMQVSEQASAPGGMSADCAEKMGLTAHSAFGQQPETPCQGLTLDCLAKMGCALPVVLIPPAVSGTSAQYRPETPAPMPVTRLVGRDLAPELEPPARLG